MKRKEIFFIEVHALGVQELEVLRKHIHEHIAGKHLAVHIFLILSPAAVNLLRESIEIVFDKLLLRVVGIGRKVRLLDIYGKSEITIAELIRLIKILVQFEEGGVGLVVERNAVVGKAHVLREVVAAAILAVDVEFHRHNVIRPRRSHGLSDALRHGVGHHRAGEFVGKQHPALAGSHAERLFLRSEFQSVGVLGIGVARPAAIATPLHLHRVGHRRPHARAVDNDFSIEIIVLARNHLPVLNIQVNARHRGSLIRQPVHTHRNIAPEGLPRVFVDGRANERRLIATLDSRHLVERKRRHGKIILITRRSHHEPQMPISFAEVDSLRGKRQANAVRQSVSLRERLHIHPLRTVGRSLHRKPHRIAGGIIARFISETNQLHIFFQIHLQIRILVKRQLFVFTRAPGRMEKSIRVIVQQHRQTLFILIVRRSVSRKHIHGKRNSRRLLRVGRRFAPHLVLNQPMLHDAPAIAGNRVDHIAVKTQARHLAHLLCTIHIHLRPLLAQLERRREALADSTHAGRYAVAVDTGNHIGEHLRIILIIKLEGGEHGQISQRRSCCAHRVQFALVVINHRVIVERDAKPPLRRSVPFKQSGWEHIGGSVLRVDKQRVARLRFLRRAAYRHGTENRQKRST